MIRESVIKMMERLWNEKVLYADDHGAIFYDGKLVSHGVLWIQFEYEGKEIPGGKNFILEILTWLKWKEWTESEKVNCNRVSNY